MGAYIGVCSCVFLTSQPQGIIQIKPEIWESVGHVLETESDLVTFVHRIVRIAKAVEKYQTDKENDHILESFDAKTRD